MEADCSRDDGAESPLWSGQRGYWMLFFLCGTYKLMVSINPGKAHQRMDFWSSGMYRSHGGRFPMIPSNKRRGAHHDLRLLVVKFLCCNGKECLYFVLILMESCHYYKRGRASSSIIWPAAADSKAPTHPWHKITSMRCWKAFRDILRSLIISLIASHVRISKTRKLLVYSEECWCKIGFSRSLF